MRAVAEEERSYLGLNKHDPFDPYKLAEVHGIPVYSLTQLLDFDLGPEAHRHFHSTRSKSWSAALVPLGTARIIVENDAHSSVRRRSNIAHELGHLALAHRRTFNRDASSRDDQWVTPRDFGGGIKVAVTISA